MSTRIRLEPKVLRWARERGQLSVDALASKLNTSSARVDAWEHSGELTLKQAQKVAHHTHTPFGYLFLDAPVHESVGIADFRTMVEGSDFPPSPELLDTVHQMQQRVAWMSEELRTGGADPLSFVGSMSIQSGVHEVVKDMRRTLEFDEKWAAEASNWEDALRALRKRVEALGVMVVRNGVVNNNTRRRLDPEEFRGFALVDAYAPLIFINGADAKSAQMFTLAHELAHLWIGEEGISNLLDLQPGDHRVERLCNAVAAEFLVPAAVLEAYWPTAADSDDRFAQLSKRFKVSRIVVACRALDLRLITKPEFFEYYDALLREHTRKTKEPGGSFWNNQNTRIGDRFGRAVVHAAHEGRLLYRDAYRLTGLWGTSFENYARQLAEKRT